MPPKGGRSGSYLGEAPVFDKKGVEWAVGSDGCGDLFEAFPQLSDMFLGGRLVADGDS